MYLKANDNRSMDQIKTNINSFRNTLSQQLQEFKSQNQNRHQEKQQQCILNYRRHKLIKAEQRQRKIILQKKRVFATAVSRERYFTNPSTMLHKQQPYMKERDLINAKSTDKFTEKNSNWNYLRQHPDYMTSIFGYRKSESQQTSKSLINPPKLTEKGEKLVLQHEEQYMKLVTLEAERHRNLNSGLYKKECCSVKALEIPVAWGKNKYVGGTFQDYEYKSDKYLDWKDKGKVVCQEKCSDNSKVWNPVNKQLSYFNKKSVKLEI